MKNQLNVYALFWIILTVLLISIILYGLKRSLQKSGWQKDKTRNFFSVATFILLIWPVTLCLLAYNNFFTDFTKLPPRPGLAVMIPLPFVLFFAFSKKGSYLLQLVPPQWLVAIQSFRIVVELLLWLAFINHSIPVQMTFEGSNFDVISGLLSLPVAWVITTNKKYAKPVAVLFNVAGLLLLINILVIAVLSMPTPFRYFMNEPANTLVAKFPFILLPGVLVPIAYSFHIFSLRQWLMKK